MSVCTVCGAVPETACAGCGAACHEDCDPDYAHEREDRPLSPRDILAADDFDERVGKLIDRLAKAGDHKMVALCELALGCGDEGAHAPDALRREARKEIAQLLADLEES